MSGYPQVTEALTALQTALQGVKDIRVYARPGENVDPPAAVLGVPRIAWEAYGDDPTSMTVPVALVAAADERSLETLLGLLPEVRTALSGVEQAAPGAAEGGLFTAGGVELPAYLIDVEVALWR